MTRIALIADMHGNTRALSAVLEDIYARSVDGVFNLGDALFGPLDPAGSARLLRDVPSVSGNCDRYLHTPPEGMRSSPNWRHTMQHIGADELAWLVALPHTRMIDDAILLCHGTPTSDDTALLETITTQGASPASNADIKARLGGITAPVIACAHTHVSRTVQLDDGRLIVNPGSVGLPAYTHDEPFAHRMEAGSPHARYAIVTRVRSGWQVEHVAVPYDWEAAAHEAETNGSADYGLWIRTGRA